MSLLHRLRALGWSIGTRLLVASQKEVPRVVWAYNRPCPRADRSKGPQGILFFLIYFVFFLEFSIFCSILHIRGNDICKMMPRGMPSFLAIGWLILTTFQNLIFLWFVGDYFGRFWAIWGPMGPGAWTMGPWAMGQDHGPMGRDHGPIYTYFLGCYFYD